MHPSIYLFRRHKIPPEPIIASQVQFNNDGMAPHQQTRESVCPEIEISFGQSTNMIFEMIRHIIVVIALVTESPKEIQHARSSVFALLTKVVLEVSR